MTLVSLLDSRGLCVFSSQSAGSDWSGELQWVLPMKWLSYHICVTDLCFDVVGCCSENSLSFFFFSFGFAVVIFGERGKGSCRSREGEDIR